MKWVLPSRLQSVETVLHHGAQVAGLGVCACGDGAAGPAESDPDPELLGYRNHSRPALLHARQWRPCGGGTHSGGAAGAACLRLMGEAETTERSGLARCAADAGAARDFAAQRPSGREMRSVRRCFWVSRRGQVTGIKRQVALHRGARLVLRTRMWLAHRALRQNCGVLATHGFGCRVAWKLIA